MRQKGRLSPRVLGVFVLACAAPLAICAEASAAGWLPPTPLSVPPQAASNPDVAMGPGGDVAAVWERASSPGHPVQASVRPANGIFTSPVELVSSGSEQQVAMASSGEAIAAWNQIDSGSSHHVIKAAVMPPGGTFSAPVTVATLGSIGETVHVHVAIDAAGDAAIAWVARNAEGKRVVGVATRAAGSGFTSPVTVSDPEHAASAPAVAVGGGRAFVVWEGFSAAQANEHVVQLARGFGSSFSAVDVSASEAAFEPSVAAAAGRATVVWTSASEEEEGPPPVVEFSSEQAGGGLTAPAPLSDPSRLASQPYVASGGTATDVAWSAEVPGEGIKVETAAVSGGTSTAPVPVSEALPRLGPPPSPRLAVNGTGGAVLAWVGGEGTRDIEASVRDGAAFGPPVVLSAPGQEALTPAVGIDAGGDAVAVWAHLDGEDSIVEAAGYDAQPPRVEVFGPSEGTAGVPLSFSASPFDVWGTTGTRISFGDGAVAAGASATHAYATPGTYSVSAATADHLGATTVASRAVHIVAPNAFTLRRAGRNVRRGTVTIVADVPWAGSLVERGAGLRSMTKRAARAGSVKFVLRAHGKALRRLARRHRVKAQVRVTFQPDGGAAAERSLKITLRRKHRPAPRRHR